MIYHIPPEHQGQNVIVAFAGGADGIYLRETASTGARAYYRASWDDLQGTFEPWNQTPAVDDDAWQKLDHPPESN